MEKYCIKHLAFAVVVFFCTLLLAACDGMDRHANVGCHQHEREALLRFRSGLIDPNNYLASWGLLSDCCKWSRVTCDNETGYVLQLNLRQTCNNDGLCLSGQLDPVLLELKHVQLLDFSNNNMVRGGHIPSFLGSFKELKYLDLSNSGFSGEIPHQLGNLSKLEYLDLSTTYEHSLHGDQLQWLKGVTSLKHLSLNFVNLSKTGMGWIHAFSTHPFLSELYLRDCNLHNLPQLPSSANFTSLRVLDLSGNQLGVSSLAFLANISNIESIYLSWSNFQGHFPHYLKELPHLQLLDVSYCGMAVNLSELLERGWRSIKTLELNANHFGGEIPCSISNLTSLISIDLSRNQLGGNIFNCIGHLTSLEQLDLSYNELNGPIPTTLGHLTSLEQLDLSYNQLNGPIPTTLGYLTSLQQLDLSHNQLDGPIPTTLGHLTSLESLNLYNNNLYGPIPTSFGKLSKLKSAYMGYNSLTGILNETHFEELWSLTYIDLSSNELVFDIKSNWTPPFQLEELYISSCFLRQSFPQWLKTQKYMKQLDFSNTSLRGSPPSWFWNFTSQLETLILSNNKIQGQLPNLFSLDSAIVVDMSFNLFSGALPCLIGRFNFAHLNLSNNQLIGSIPENCTGGMISVISLSRNRIHGTIPSWFGRMEQLSVLDLSHNQLSGSIPMNLGNCTSLSILDLSDNFLRGGIPRSFGQLLRLSSLHLNKNTLSGKLSLSLRNCSEMQLLDVGDNNFSGSIKPLISDGLMNTRVLRLRSNNFIGKIPSNISYMSSLQIFDISNNYLSGLIPTSLGKLTGITRVKRIREPLIYEGCNDLSCSDFVEYLSLVTKGQMLEYKNILDLVTSIDLSNNRFYGPIPDELTRLGGLFSLNLSNNHLSGKIPWNIGSLKSLESLDLSNNQLTGEIPSSLSRLSSLSKLNLSNNNLQGKIPSGNQLQTLNDPSIYYGNQDLCGAPLAKDCPRNETGTTEYDSEEGEGHDVVWLCISLILGFVVGFWGLIGLLIFKKSFRILYFSFFNALGDKIFILVALTAAKLKKNNERNRG